MHLATRSTVANKPLDSGSHGFSSVDVTEQMQCD